MKLSVAFYLLLVFVSGVIVGGLAHRFFGLREVRAERSRSAEWRKKYVEEMQSRLQLRGDQLQRLNEVLDATRNRHRQLRQKMKPEMTAIHKEHVDQVRAILTDVQLTEYEKIRKEWENRRDRKRKHPR
jgi:hypothetical protein